MNNYPVFIPANVRYDRDLPPNAKLIYGELLFLCENKGFCWASNAYFARLYNVDKMTVSKWITLLRKKNYIFFKDIDKNIYGVDENVNNLRQICITPIDKNVYPNKKNNNKKNNISRGREKKHTENYGSYDLDAFEEYLNSKD